MGKNCCDRESLLGFTLRGVNTGKAIGMMWQIIWRWRRVGSFFWVSQVVSGIIWRLIFTGVCIPTYPWTNTCFSWVYPNSFPIHPHSSTALNRPPISWLLLNSGDRWSSAVYRSQCWHLCQRLSEALGDHVAPASRTSVAGFWWVPCDWSNFSNREVFIPWFYEILCGYGSIPIDTIFSGMNIHLPAILMFTRGTRFWPIPMLITEVLGYGSNSVA